MRCKACNALLDDLESTNKDLTTGEYLDMCRTCLEAGSIVCELTIGDYYEDITQWEVGGYSYFGRLLEGEAEED